MEQWAGQGDHLAGEWSMDMKRVVGHIFFLFTLLVLPALLSACGSGGFTPGETNQAAEQQLCSASVLTLDGSRIELTEITSEWLLVSVLIPQTFGAGAVELKPAAIEKAILVQGTDLHEIQLRDFVTLTGYLSGSLNGTNQLGDHQVEWKNIREAAISCDPGQAGYVPPQGVEALFYDEVAGSLPLYGLKVIQSYCTPSGEPVNGYQQCINGSDTEYVLRVNVTQDGNVYIEYQIPLETLISMSWADGIQYQSPRLGLQTLRGEFHTSWALKPEGSMMSFQGENAFGTWHIAPTGNFRVDFSRSATPDLALENPDTVGSCTTTAGERLGVETANVESIQLSINDSPWEVPWEDVRQVKFFGENSWLLSQRYAKFWQTVEITLVDGQVLRGEAYLEEGFISAVRPDGIRMSIPLYGLSEISLER